MSRFDEETGVAGLPSRGAASERVGVGLTTRQLVKNPQPLPITGRHEIHRSILQFRNSVFWNSVPLPTTSCLEIRTKRVGFDPC